MILVHKPMKKILTILCLSIALFALWVGGVNAAIISKPATNLGLVGYWSMDEGSGSYAGDASGNKNTGTLTNGPTWVDGKRGKALNFDGSNDYVNAGNGASLNITTKSMTVSLWIYMNDLSSPQNILNKGINSNDIDNNYNIFIYSSTLRFRLENSTTYSQIALNTNIFSTNKWYYITFVSNETGLYFYKNGVLDTSSLSVPVTPKANSESLYIGGGFGDAGTGQDFNGSIDEVRIYNRALSAAEIQALYKSGAAKLKVPTNTGLVGYWSMNEGTGSFTGDSSGNKNTGTLTGGPTWVDGKRGKALSFDGSNDYVNLGVSPQLTPNNITISAWVKADTFQSLWHGIVSNMTSWGTGFSLQIGTTQKIAAMVSGTYLTTNWTPKIDTWYHIVATHDSTTNENVLYVNGNRENSSTYPVSYEANAKTYIGVFYTSPNLFFDGLIDEVRVYNRALSAAEIQALYNSSAAKFAPPSNTGLVGYWSFDDGAGISATDFSGKNNAGVFPGGTSNPTWVDGKRGKALSFDGSDDYVDVSMPLGATFTISAWVYRTKGGAWQAIVAQSNSRGFFIDNTANKLNNYPSGPANTVLAANTWYHAVLVQDGTNSIYYLNGSNDGTIVASPSMTVEYIGSDNSNEALGGLIDEVRIYNRALSASEVQALYNSR